MKKIKRICTGIGVAIWLSPNPQFAFVISGNKSGIAPILKEEPKK